MSSITAFLIVCQVATATGNDALLRTAKAVMQVESGGDPLVVGDGGRAVGAFQIHKIMVAECNRIVVRQKWTMEDRIDPVKSLEMFKTYCLHYWPKGGPEQWARGWNGGPNGPKRASTLDYWRKVNRIMQDGR